MDISKKTDYALRMLAELVEDPDSVISVRRAAEDSNVPYSFARSIQHDLAVAGLVTNSRGANGGMRLAVDPREVSLLQVIEAVQDDVGISCCHTGADGASVECPRRVRCHYAPVWCNAEHMLQRFFGSVTLYQLIVEGRSPMPSGGFELVSESEARAAAGITAAAEDVSAGQGGVDG